MYQVDDRDKAVELKDVPQSSIGAPCPLMLGAEGTLVLAYYIESRDEGWDGTTIRMVGPNSDGEPVALVRFHRCHASMFGPPNDEAFAGHPLSGRGLKPYSANVIEHSSWVRSLERMNSVHPYHRPEAFESYKHFIFAFHDSTFECIAYGYKVYLKQGSLWSLLPEMQRLVAERDV